MFPCGASSPARQIRTTQEPPLVASDPTAAVVVGGAVVPPADASVDTANTAMRATMALPAATPRERWRGVSDVVGVRCVSVMVRLGHGAAHQRQR